LDSELPEIKLVDDLFAHAYCMGSGDLEVYPKNFRWYRGPEERDLCVFTDTSLHKADCVKAKYKIALLMESPEITGECYDWCAKNSNKFDAVLTFDHYTIEKINALHPKTKVFRYMLGGTWVDRTPPEDYANKASKVCFIYSDKSTTTGHQLRHMAAEMIKSCGFDVDMFGRGHNPFNDKADILGRYKFSIVIENTMRPFYFTEKLTDCFACMTIPIYWGSYPYAAWSDNGIIRFTSIGELWAILRAFGDETFCSDRYYHLHQFACENYGYWETQRVTEDHLWDVALAKILEDLQ